jgi:hypothetical protein
MAHDRERLPDADFERIYDRRIRPDVLDGIEKSKTPTAVLVGGQPGAGKSYALARIRANLATTVGASAVISGDELREYHPYWRAHALTDPLAANATRPDVSQWCTRLVIDAMARKLNLVLEASLREPEATATLARRLKREGYQVATVALATDRDQSRQVTVARYDAARTAGATPRFVSAPDHDTAYDELRESLSRLENELAVDRLQLVARDGRQLYANEVSGTQWVSEPRAVYVLDDFRERRLTARELADSALRWHVLVQRLSADPAVPSEVTDQAAKWCDEATAKAESDPDARQLLAWGREAEAFRTMNRVAFLAEYPRHARIVERLQEAIAYAEKQFEQAADRERFIEQARSRLAERIAEGRTIAAERGKSKSAEQGSRTR